MKRLLTSHGLLGWMKSPFQLPPDISINSSPERALSILHRMWGGRGVFTCTIGNTMTSTIPGVSDAGDTPELTLFTPAADVELLFHGRTLCMDGLPINPGGIPTPATLTMAALGLSGMAVHVLDGGTKVKPYVPTYNMGGECGQDIRGGQALVNVQESYEKGVMLGEMFSRDHDFLVASESCAGGTTTALAVMMAMGVLRENLVSSSSPRNPKELKSRIVAEALQAAGTEIGGMADRPLDAIRCVGDPMMPANVGLVVGAARRIPVILGGGTQMCAVLAAAMAMDGSIQDNLVLGTTRWMVNDPNSDICRIVEGIADVPIISVNMDYGQSPHEGLQAYEWGYIKEGVGCGGSSLAAIIGSCGRIGCDALLDRVHQEYRRMLNL